MKAEAPPHLKRNRGQQPHLPSPQTLATVKAMSGVGYSQTVIARHIGVSPPTLREHYRELIDNAVESMCAMVFANLVKTACTKNDAASVLAAKFILCVRANWRECSKVEIEHEGKGIVGLLALVKDAEDARRAAAEAQDGIADQTATYETHTPAPAQPRH